MLKLSASFDLTNYNTGLCKVFHQFWNALLTAWRLFMANDKSIPFKQFVHPYHNAYSPLLFLQDESKVHHNTLNTMTRVLFWIQWCQTTKIMATEGGMSDKFQSLIYQKRKLTWNFKLQKPIIGYKYEHLLWV